MGKQQSKELDKYQASFLLKNQNKVINIKPYKMNDALNVHYIYFHIKDYSINNIMNCDFELYISNIIDLSTNLINEDVLKGKIINNTRINVIDKKSYYDIDYVTNNSKKVIFRSAKLSDKSFDIVYIM